MEKSLLSGGISSDLLGFVFNLDLLEDLNNAPQENIYELLNKTLLVGGKRLRPLLTLLVGDFFGVSRETIIPYAKAIELVHAASLSHDDVVDNASTRRGLASINIQSSNKKAVLTGDYLLSQVIVRLCKEGDYHLVELLSMTIQDLALGEWLQEDNRLRPELINWDSIEEVARKKTSSVISFATQVAPIIRKSDEKIVERMKYFGVSLGLAFQFVDDALDFGEADVTGKASKIDLENGIINSVTYEFFSRRKDLFDLWTQDRESFFSRFDKDDFGQDLIKAKNDILVRVENEIANAKNNLNMVKDYLAKQESGMSSLQIDSYYSLCFLLDYLVKRTF